MQTYVVQKGDTLYGISGQFGISIANIKLANGLTSDSITVGQVLKIPTTSTTALYIVKPGDTLYSIARNYSTTVAELMTLNNLTSSTLTIGQQLRIPINVDNGSTNYVLYSVVAGDNLYSIARKYGVTVDQIKELNNLTSNLLSIGQQLKIPITDNDNVNYDLYLVRTGDTLYSIAKKYNLTIDQIKKVNNLTSDLLSIGQILKIPVSDDLSTENYQTYVVRSGDTLYSIANTYGMSVDELMKINNLTSTNLSIGQIIKVKQNYYSNIPLGSKCYGTGYQEPNYLTYTVKSGDSLYSIAKAYNTSIANLIILNNLTSYNLSIGQVLKIREV